MAIGKNRKLTIGALMSFGLITAVGAPVTLQMLASRGYDVPSLEMPQSLMALLDARSPGERETGALTATKHRKIAENAFRPHERALGKIINPNAAPPAELVDAIMPPATTEVAPAYAPPPTLADVIPKTFPTPGNASPPGTTLISPPGGGTPGTPGTPGAPGTPGTPQTPEVPSAVPEPATWLTMLLGFGVIGAAMRRRRVAPPGSARLA